MWRKLARHRTVIVRISWYNSVHVSYTRSDEGRREYNQVAWSYLMEQLHVACQAGTIVRLHIV